MINWRTIKLGDFLDIDDESLVEIEPTANYTIAGVQNAGKGVINKRIVVGSDLTMKFYKSVKPNQLLWCKVDTRAGAFGVTTNENINTFVSTNMQLANIDVSKVDVKLISYLFKRKELHRTIDNLSQGSTNRRYAKKEQIFGIEISLPSLDVQKVIVAKIESIIDKVEQVQKLKIQQEREFKNLRYSIMCDVEKMFPLKKISEMCFLKKGSFPIMKTDAGKYPFVVTAAEKKTACEYDFDCNAVCIPLVSSTGHGNAAMHRVHYQEGKFALSNLLCALTPIDEHNINTKFLYELFMAKKEEYFVPLMQGTSNVSLNEGKISMVEIPIPPIEEQLKIVTMLDKLNEVKNIHNQTDLNLNQLIPSLLDKAFKGELVK